VTPGHLNNPEGVTATLPRVTEESETPQRLPWWLTALGPVGLGLLSGLGYAFIPWLAADMPDLSTAERFWSPVVAGVVVSIVLQTGRWWLQRKDAQHRDESAVTMVRLTGLVVIAAAVIVLLLDPDSLFLLMGVPVVAGLVALGLRRPAVPAENRRLGLYCACVLCLAICVLTIVRALTPVS
jgi:O-antigen/teichoic acid export membrane protein